MYNIEKETVICHAIDVAMEYNAGFAITIDKGKGSLFLN